MAESLSEVSSSFERDAQNDWRLSFGLAATAVWLLLGFLYISSTIGWREFAAQNAPSLGSFLEGAFAPLAFLWLVVGFFLQQRQLNENTEAVRLQYLEMRRSAEQAEIQARAIAANELHVRQDIFIKTVETVKEQLGFVSGFLCLSYDEEVGNELVGSASGEMFRQLGMGDPAVFSRRVITYAFQHPERKRDFLFGSEIRERHSRRFMTIFERLMAAGEESDPRGFLRDALHDSSHGRLYRLMKEQDPNATGPVPFMLS